MEPRPRKIDRPDPRGVADEILRRVETAGAFAAPLLEDRERRFRDGRDGALLHELVLGALRRRASLDHALAKASHRPLEEIDPSVYRVLRIGAYEILYLDRVPGYASVDEAVESTKRRVGRGAAGFVNGVLRTVVREAEALLPAVPREGDLPGLVAYGSHPPWWLARAVARWGWSAVVSLVDANNRPAETVLRAASSAGSPESLAARLAAEGIATEPGIYDSRALRVVRGSVGFSDAFRESAWVQDEASQLVPRLLGDLGAMPVLDACAAPGGKTFCLADAVHEGGIVVAADRHPGRLGRLVRGVRRLRFEGVLPVASDLTVRPALRGPFPSALVDAPCSGTGTFRRRPEIRWRLHEADLAALAARQGAILDRVAELVPAHGVLVYSVCSVEPEEGEDVLGSFLSRNRDFDLDDPTPWLPDAARRFVGPDRIVRTVSDPDRLDGFQAARLARR